MKVLYSCRAEISTYITLPIYPENDMSYSVLQLNNIPPIAPQPPLAPEQVSSSFYQTRQFRSSAETPRSLMSLRGGAAIPGGDKWKYFQTRNPSQSKRCKWTKTPLDWRFEGGKKHTLRVRFHFYYFWDLLHFSDISHSLQWHLLVTTVTMVPEVMG